MNLNNCYLVPMLCMTIIYGPCLMRDCFSFKSENKGCSIYMGNIFYGHAPIVRGLFLLISIVLIHMLITLMPKDVELIMIIPLCCGTAA